MKKTTKFAKVRSVKPSVIKVIEDPYSSHIVSRYSRKRSRDSLYAVLGMVTGIGIVGVFLVMITIGSQDRVKSETRSIEVEPQMTAEEKAEEERLAKSLEDIRREEARVRSAKKIFRWRVEHERASRDW